MHAAYPENRKRTISASLSRLFPGVEFKVSCVDVPGRSLNGVTWDGGRGAPNQSEVRGALRDLDPQLEFTLYYNDPRLIGIYSHLLRQGGPQNLDTLACTQENLRRHLAKSFPETTFDISGSLGAFGIDTSMTVSWLRKGDQGPTKEQLRPLVNRFLFERNELGGPATADDMNFHRMFGGVHFLTMTPQWAPEEKRATSPTP